MSQAKGGSKTPLLGTKTGLNQQYHGPCWWFYIIINRSKIHLRSINQHEYGYNQQELGGWWLFSKDSIEQAVFRKTQPAADSPHPQRDAANKQNHRLKPSTSSFLLVIPLSLLVTPLLSLVIPLVLLVTALFESQISQMSHLFRIVGRVFPTADDPGYVSARHQQPSWWSDRPLMSCLRRSTALPGVSYQLLCCSMTTT